MGDLKQVLSEWREFLSTLNDPLWILEIGTFRGCGAIDLSKISKNVITIDTNRRKFKIPTNCKCLILDSTKQETLCEIKKIIGESELDALFIDGGHTYDVVKSDFNMYKHLVREGGIVGIHDIVDSPRHRSKKCDVYIFWDEIKNNYKYKEIIHDGSWGGIGVLWV